VVRTLVSILAGIVTHIVLFTYLSGRTTCAVTIGGEGDAQVGDCFMTVWDNLGITYPGGLFLTDVQEKVTHPGGLPMTDTWQQFLSPPFLIPAVAGLLVGLVLWAVWARRQGQSQKV
jgi:hypothetical protein